MARGTQSELWQGRKCCLLLVLASTALFAQPFETKAATVAPEVTGPGSVLASPDSLGRLTLRSVLARCPASSGASCSVLASGGARSVLKLVRLRFTLPASRSSLIRMRLTKGSLSRVKVGMRVKLPVRIQVWDAARRFASRRVNLTIRASMAIRRSLGLDKQSEKRPARRQALQPGTGEFGTAPVPGRSKAPNHPTQATVTGISDQNGDTFLHPLFTALPISTVRLVTPWNSVYTEPEVLDRWLTAARVAGLEPLIALEHAQNDRCPRQPCRLPSVEIYAAAFATFHARYPWVRLITPWNEPNHGSQPTAAHPRRAADFYNVARSRCDGCILIAGDLLDAPGMRHWLTEYERGLGESPRVWGLHNYYDTTYFSSAGVDTLLDQVRGEVWLTETGGIVSFTTGDGLIALPPDEVRAEASVDFAFQLARRHRNRVTRIYLYQWRSHLSAQFDAGLLRPDGSVRPAWYVVRRELGLKPSAATDVVGRGPTTSTSPPARAIVRRIRLTSHGYLAASLNCVGEHGQTCSGRLSVEGADYRHARLVNGHPRARTLEPRTRAFEIPIGTSKLPFILPRQVLKPAVERRRLRLRITQESDDDPGHSRSHIVDLTTPSKLRILAKGRR